MNYLRYNKEEIPVIIDYHVIARSCAKLKIPLSAFDKTIENPEQTATVLQEAIRRGCDLEKKEMPTYEVGDILSYCYGQYTHIFVADVFLMFAPSEVKEELESLETDEDKKKYLMKAIAAMTATSPSL